ncbi:MAG: hypothetical protein JWN48_3461 [Myxococcaceae bacterium]|nr:hypothetical protein [Myxococcaceae bacterium]
MAIQIRRGALVSWFVLQALAASGCDDPEDAQEQCKSLVVTYCDRVVSCAEQGQLLNASFGRAELRDECEDFLKNDAHCEDAVRVGGSFDRCVDESSQLSCTVLNDVVANASSSQERYLGAIPSSCEDSVKYSD